MLHKHLGNDHKNRKNTNINATENSLICVRELELLEEMADPENPVVAPNNVPPKLGTLEHRLSVKNGPAKKASLAVKDITYSAKLKDGSTKEILRGVTAGVAPGEGKLRF